MVTLELVCATAVTLAVTWVVIELGRKLWWVGHRAGNHKYYQSIRLGNDTCSVRLGRMIRYFGLYLGVCPAAPLCQVFSYEYQGFNPSTWHKHNTRLTPTNQVHKCHTRAFIPVKGVDKYRGGTLGILGWFAGGLALTPMNPRQKK